MSIMQQSSKAQDRTLGVWFQHIQQGMVKLPRFQRFEAWDRSRIISFLNTIINNLPVGVTLALEVAGPEKFQSRYISTAEPANPGPVTQHLLDGQQRLTAFWRALHNNYERETFFVYLPQFDSNPDKSGAETEIRCIPRWLNNNRDRMPRWAEAPDQCLLRGMLPTSLLRPGDIANEIEHWLDQATRPLKPKPTDEDAFTKLEQFSEFKKTVAGVIATLRERVTHFNLPYLSLPADTSKDVALQVFINMNTNSKPLSLYDIIVAEVQNVTGTSLHALEASLIDKCPKVSRYGNVSGLILSTSALLQDKPPSTRGMIETDKKLLLKNWSKLECGLKRMAGLLEDQGVFDMQRLPSNTVLPVIAATYELIPKQGDFLAKAEMLLRRYLWSSFFTDRYANSAGSRAYADFKALKALLQNRAFSLDDLATVPVLNRKEHPLADVDSLMVAGWPRAAGIEARAIMAVTTYLGAKDFADDRKANYESIQSREYHHIYPDALLQEADLPSYLALNCALITWNTNRMIGRKDPLDYLQERVNLADEEIVCERLKSHLISYELLSRAHYAGLEGDALKAKLEKDFKAFLQDRAERVFKAMTALADGNSPELHTLWSDPPAELAGEPQ